MKTRETANIRKLDEKSKKGLLVQPTAGNLVPELHCIGLAVAPYVSQLPHNVNAQKPRGLHVCAQNAMANKGFWLPFK
jgi:hypothetical protein